MSKHFHALSLIAAGLAVMGVTEVGCGGGSMGGSGTGGSNVTTTVTTASATGAGGGGGATPMGNHSFATASPISVDNAPIKATLVDTNTPDFYWFSGTAGDRLVMGAIAEELGTNTNPFNPMIIDTALTLYGPDMQQVAADNDGWPRESTDSQLYFQIPKSGTYYIEVEDCNSYAEAHTEVVCNDIPSSSVTTFDYQVFVLHTSKINFPESNAGTSQNGTTANAVPITYVVPTGASAGEYGYSVIDGDFKSTTDTHVFTFTPPMDTKLEPGQRPRVEFYVQPAGTDDGDGSTSNIKIWATDMTGTTVIALVNDEKAFGTGDTEETTNSGPLDFSFPVTLGQTYYLFVQSTASTSTPTTDDYFIQHYVGNALIGTAKVAGNTSYTSAQTLTAPNPTFPGVFAMDGDLATPGTGSDWYKMTVPASTSGGYIGCDVDRAGSGLGGFAVSVFDMTGTHEIGSIPAEPANPTTDYDNYTSMTGIPVSAGLPVFVSVTAASELMGTIGGASVPVTGPSYRCFIEFQ